MTRKIFLFIQILVLSAGLLGDDPNISQMSLEDQTELLKECDHLLVSIIFDGKTDKTWQLSKTLRDVTDKLSNYVKFVSFDCSSKPGACSESVLKDLPAVNMFIPNKSFRSLNERMTEKPYVGLINGKEIGEAISKEIPYLGEVLDSENFESFVELDGNKVILFTNKESVPIIFKGISMKFRDRIRIGVVLANSTELGQQYEITDYPTILILQDSEKIKYRGKQEFEDVSKFIKDYASDEKIYQVPLEDASDSSPPSDPDSNSEDPSTPEEDLEQPQAASYISVNDSTLIPELEKLSGFGLVHFHNTNPLKYFDSIPERFKGIATVLDFDCSTSSYCDTLQSLQPLPFIRFYPSAHKSIDLNLKNLEDLEDRVSREVKSEYSTITARGVNDMLRSIYPSGKVVSLLISKNSVPLSFKFLSSDPHLQHFTRFIHLNAEPAELTEFFDLPRFPIVLTIFQANSKQKLQTLDFGDDLKNYPELHKFFAETALSHFFRGRARLDEEDLDEVSQLYDEKAWNNKCAKKKVFCLIAFLKRNKEQGVVMDLRKVNTVMRQRNLDFNTFWMDSECFEEFRKALGLHGESGLVLVNHGKDQVWVQGEEFGEDEMFGFVEKSLLGKVEMAEHSVIKFHNTGCKDLGKPVKRKRIHKAVEEDL